MSPPLKKFTKEFTEIQIISLINLISKFNQFTLNVINRDLIKFQILLEFLRNCTVLQKKINLIIQFQRVINLILNNLIPKIAKIFINNINIKNPLNYYKNKKILPKIY